MKYDLTPGKGLKKDENGLLTIAVDSTKDNLSVTEDGLYAKAGVSLGNQYVDEWTITSNRKSEETEKTIWGNARVVAKCYTLCMLKNARTWSSSDTTDESRFRVLRTKDPASATASDLKTADDIVRELNLPVFYATKDSNGQYAVPPMIPRPGSLIAFSDVIYATTTGSTRIYENGSRFPTLTTYTFDGNGDIETHTAPQKIYALFMVTRAQYTEYGASTQAINNTKFKSATPSDYRCLMRIRLQCLWSNQEAFNGLLNTNGWKKGEFLQGKNGRDYGEWNLNNIYGAEAIEDDIYNGNDD